MAGTFADQATLATDNAFIAKVQRAMITTAVEKYYSSTAQDFSVLLQSKQILDNGASDAARIASLCIAADATIQANSPAVPTDAATQTAVNVVLTALLK